MPDKVLEYRQISATSDLRTPLFGACFRFHGHTSFDTKKAVKFRHGKVNFGSAVGYGGIALARPANLLGEPS